MAPVDGYIQSRMTTHRDPDTNAAVDRTTALNFKITTEALICSQAKLLLPARENKNHRTASATRTTNNSNRLEPGRLNLIS